jgi:non-ribosomal peptide synthetase component F
MPQSLHGGPGRAGGGEELGGMRALGFYHRRSAVQASTAVLGALTRPEPAPHRGDHMTGHIRHRAPNRRPVPGEHFNFAQHLLQPTPDAPGKAAFIDDRGTLSYGALDERVRRMAAGLRAWASARGARAAADADGNDWPVSFLGAMYAGLVPVAVNTLLTADDYAYMLEHSRAQAVLVSGALLPTLTAAMTKSTTRCSKVIVSRPVAPLHPSEVEFEAFPAAQAPLAPSRRPPARRSGLLALLVRLHRPAQGHGAFARQPLLDGRAVRQGRAGPDRSDVCFSPPSCSSPTAWAMR